MSYCSSLMNVTTIREVFLIAYDCTGFHTTADNVLCVKAATVINTVDNT